MLGAAICRQLQQHGYTHLVGLPGHEPDLADKPSVDRFFADEAPEYVFIAAGRSGGIEANRKYPADLMLDNLLVEAHLIEAAYRRAIKKLLYLASSCCYPKNSPQPMRIEFLMTGPVEETNDAYAAAKIAGMKLCRAYQQQHGSNFISAIPANAFGPGDDFSLEDSHVIAALIRKMHMAKVMNEPMVEVWGTGNPRRDFIYVDDLAAACLHLMHNYVGAEPINISGQTNLSIRELATLIKTVVGYSGEIWFNTERPDGMPLKALDGSRLAELGWQPQTSLRSALAATYQAFLKTQEERPHV